MNSVLGHHHQQNQSMTTLANSIAAKRQHNTEKKKKQGEEGGNLQHQLSIGPNGRPLSHIELVGVYKFTRNQ